MPSGEKILIADDDIELAQLLASYIQAEGFDVQTVHAGDAVKAAVVKAQPDLLVLDVMLPGLNGFDVLKAIRLNSELPVLMLTAKGDDVDRIVGLELGADDYMPKPCNPRELVARIRAILRRSDSKKSVGEALDVGDLHISLSRREALLASNVLPLTGLELNLLYELAKCDGEIVSKDQLSESVLGRELSPYDRSIDVHISNLRKKLAQVDEQHQWIVAVRGKGYQLVANS